MRRFDCHPSICMRTWYIGSSIPSEPSPHMLPPTNSLLAPLGYSTEIKLGENAWHKRCTVRLAKRTSHRQHALFGQSAAGKRPASREGDDTEVRLNGRCG